MVILIKHVEHLFKLYSLLHEEVAEPGKHW